MIKRRDFLKKSGMIAMAAAFPGIVNAEVKAADVCTCNWKVILF